MRHMASLLAVLALTAGVSGEVRFEQKDAAVALVRDGAVMWRFNYGDDLTKPYIHPLALADGTVLTWERPADHVWHYGLWFSWKYINGVNYWEERDGRAAGVTDWDAEAVKVETRPDGSAVITMEVVYHEPNEPAVLKEQRRLEFSPVDEAGTYRIDWTSRFEALAERVELDRTPLPDEPGGKDWGGYAGLSYRAHADVEDRGFVSTQGPVELSGPRTRLRGAKGFEFSAKLEGKDYGVAMLDHPENLNAPSPWFVIRFRASDFVSPAVLCYGPHTMSRGEGFSLRYRLVVHEGRWDAAQLKSACAEFAEGR